MLDAELDHLKYPTGQFMKPTVVSAPQLKAWIQEIKDLPGLIRAELKDMKTEDYFKTYRPGGWNINQVIHHLADSHMNSFIRYKLSLTEENPVIKPYLENKWAEMPDETILMAGISLDILTALHQRWSFLLDQMSASDFDKGYFHPDKNRVVSLEEATALYAWHCRHHLAHIRNAKHS